MCDTDMYMTVYCRYGMPTVSSIDKIIGLFGKRDLRKGRYSAKEICNFIDPTDRSHPICVYIRVYCVSVSVQPHIIRSMHCQCTVNVHYVYTVYNHTVYTVYSHTVYTQYTLAVHSLCGVHCVYTVWLYTVYT